MGSLAALTAGLALAVGILVVSNAELVYRLTDSDSSLCPIVPYATGTAPSRFVCSTQCKKASSKCNGFQYLPDGTCQLYRIYGGGEATGGATAGPERPAIFLQRSASSCPGTASDTCACPPGFTRCAGRCLAHILTKYTQPDAEAACAALGAHLAVLRSQAENQCAADAAQAVYDLTRSSRIRLWLGVTDIVTEGTFVGADAPCSTAPLPLNNTWWLDGEPSGSYGGVDENCVNFVPSGGGGWNDDACSYTHYPLCQLANCYRPECL